MRIRMMIAILIPACSSSQIRRPGDGKIECLGSASAKHAAVYLHDVDTIEPGGAESSARDALALVAQDLKIQFALARSARECAGDAKKRCWEGESGDGAREGALERIREAAARCFPYHDRYGLVAFGEGGYAALSLYRRCLVPREIRWTAVVASGMLRGQLPRGQKDIRGCGELVFVLGYRDTENFDPYQNYIGELENWGAKPKLVEFDGAHQVPYKPMLEAIRPLLN